MKYVFGFLTLVMGSFVFFQYNDPDPAIWMAIYGLAMLILGLATFGKTFKYVLITGHVVFGIGIILLFPSFMDWLTIEKGQNLMQRMSNSKMYIEETREFLGLCIAFACISLVWIPILKKK
ncbi:MAG: transmembrane 220 family protein [Bacteroidota bacterium]|nr:transmembrane 220 family protein [Bacteroidota bacterium]